MSLYHLKIVSQLIFTVIITIMLLFVGLHNINLSSIIDKQSPKSFGKSYYIYNFTCCIIIQIITCTLASLFKTFCIIIQFITSTFYIIIQIITSTCCTCYIIIQIITWTCHIIVYLRNCIVNWPKPSNIN